MTRAVPAPALSPAESDALAAAGLVETRPGHWRDPATGEEVLTSTAVRRATGSHSDPTPHNGRAPAAATAEALIEPTRGETDSMDPAYSPEALAQLLHPLAALGNASLRLEASRALITLPDDGVGSYRTFVRVKNALPRYEVLAPRTIACHSADLAKLGLPTAMIPGGWEPDGAPLYADQAYVLDVALRRRRFAAFCEAGWASTGSRT